MLNKLSFVLENNTYTLSKIIIFLFIDLNFNKKSPRIYI